MAEGVVSSGMAVRRHGLTFIELIIAATMTSVLFMGLGAHLRGGVQVWRRTTQTSEALQQRRIALDRIERDLANAFVLDEKPGAYGDTAGQLPAQEFGSSRLAWFTIEEDRVKFVTYECLDHDHDEVTDLLRTSQFIGQARAKSTAIVPEVVLPHCESLKVRFAYMLGAEGNRLTWSESWQGDPNKKKVVLPRLIEVTIISEGQESSRVCAVPVGLLRELEP